MTDIRLKINNASGKTLAISRPCADGISLVYMADYQKGDRIELETNASGHYFIKFDETMPETLIFVEPFAFGGFASFTVPLDDEKVCYSPKAFYGNCHLLTARKAQKEEINAYRNLAFNPYDRHNNKGFYPHASANVETRGEAVFAARNAIDGIHENSSHGVYPYASWGINKDPNAAIKISFGREVKVNKVRITLRADFPHDNWWVKGDLIFSDKSVITADLCKTHLPQEILFDTKIINELTFTNLIKSDELSPFPALTQIEVWGS